MSYEEAKQAAVAAVVAMLEAADLEERDANLVMGEFLAAFQQAAEDAMRRSAA